MTGDERRGGPGGFSPAELEDLDDREGYAPVDRGADARLARRLEALAAESGARPSSGFADRVMDAVVAEPGPAPVRAAGRAIRRHALHDLGAAIRDALRVSLGHGFPTAVRAQALALVLIVAALGAGSGMATAGAVGWLREGPLAPAPTKATPAGPTTGPAGPAATGSDEARGSTERPSSTSLEEHRSAEPGASGDRSGQGSHDGSPYGPMGGSGDRGGPGGGDGSSGRGSDTPHASERPTDHPTDTPRPAATPKP